MSKQITLKRALYTLGFLILMTGMVLTGPLQNAYGQEEGPVIPPPPRLEPYPVEQRCRSSWNPKIDRRAGSQQCRPSIH